MDLRSFVRRDTIAEEKSIPLPTFLDAWASERTFNRNTAGKLVDAIGPPEVVDTATDPRLGRIFCNRTIYLYPAFAHLYGIEETLRKIMRFLEHGAEGLEQVRQILYLKGPVGSGKSTIIETLKRKFEDTSVYVLAVPGPDGKTIKSPVFESPLGLFDETLHGAQLEDRFKIPRWRLRVPMSRWAAEQLQRFDGDLSQFLVVEVKPSMALRTCIARVEPGGSSSDVGALIGRTRDAAQHVAGDGYDYSGGLNRTTQGILEMFEMFNASEEFLRPLMGMQEYKYTGAGAVGELPFEGVTIAHSNEAEWLAFKGVKKPEDAGVSQNEGLVDRIFPVDVPYCVRLTEEGKLYEQYLANSELRHAPCVPGTLELLARFAVATRVVADDRDKRIRIYDGRSIGQREKTADDYRKAARWREGMGGLSTRFVMKQIPQIAEQDPANIGLDPVNLLEGLNQIVIRESIPDFAGRSALHLLEQDIVPQCRTLVTRLIQEASFEDYDSYAKAKFDHYIALADVYCEDEPYKDLATGEVWSREQVEQALLKHERGMNVTHPREFRRDVVKNVLRHQGDQNKKGEPAWNALSESLRVAFERNIMPTKEDLLSLISYGKRKEVKEQEKHDAFVARLMKRAACNEVQARRMVEWYERYGA